MGWGFVFWEETRRARKQHRCDDCFATIEPGDEYTRCVFSPDGKTLMVSCRHLDPACPESMLEFMGDEDPPRTFLATALEKRVHVVAIRQQNGSITYVEKTALVPVTVVVEEEEEDDW